jgi:hypothetical protein
LVFFSLQLAFEPAVLVMLTHEFPALLIAVLLVFGKDFTPVVERSKALLTRECFGTGFSSFRTAASVLRQLFVIRAGLFGRLVLNSA